MKCFYVTIILLLGLNSIAQNLVPNDDFEFYTSCPSNSGELYKLLNWIDPTSASSDYYNSCGSNGANVPYCGNGYQTAYLGDGYVGIWVYNGIGSNFREYISVELDTLLKTNRCYKVEFYVNLHNYSGFAIKQLGVILSDSLFTTPNFQQVLNYSPSIEEDIFFDDTIIWTKINGYYVAQGGEKYITIGNFRTDSQTDTVSITGNSYPGAYYLVDKVLVEEIPACDTLGVREQSSSDLISIYPNPSNGLFNINNSKDEDGVLIIYDLSGSKVYSATILKKSSNLIQLDMSNGMYLYTFHYRDYTSYSGKLFIIK